MKVFGVKKILGDEKIRERKREKKWYSILEIVLDFVFWDFNFRRFCVLFSVLQCIGLGSLKASGILQSVRVVVQDEQQQRDQRYQWKCGWTWRRKYLGWLDAKQVKKNSSKYQYQFDLF